VALAADLGIELFPSWDGGLTVRMQDGERTTYDGLLPPEHADAAAAMRRSGQILTKMGLRVPADAPWAADDAAAWDTETFRGWLAKHLEDAVGAAALANALEGVFGGGPGETSLLAALAIIRSGAHEITRLTAAHDLGPERRFVGGAQQLCERMAQQLRRRVICGAYVTQIIHGPDSVQVRADHHAVTARRAIITLPPTLVGRIRYGPALPANRDQLTQRTPMGWVINVHCVYRGRFWADDGLSGKASSDHGAVRATADNSPPAGAPGILVGFIQGPRRAPSHRQLRSSAARRWSPILCATSVSGRPPRCPTTSGAGAMTRTHVGRTAVSGPQGCGRLTDTPSARRSGRCTGPGRRPRPLGTRRWKAPCAPARRSPTRWRRSSNDRRDLATRTCVVEC
jgi:monoamine oxidase